VFTTPPTDRIGNYVTGKARLSLVKKEINTKTKLQVYRTVMEPSLLYGNESWPARGKEISRINAFTDGLQGKQDETASVMKE
jgi:hypothetical protein